MRGFRVWLANRLVPQGRDASWEGPGGEAYGGEGTGPKTRPIIQVNDVTRMVDEMMALEQDDIEVWWAKHRIDQKVMHQIGLSAVETFKAAIFSSAFGMEINTREDLQELIAKLDEEDMDAEQVLSGDEVFNAIGSIAVAYWRFGWETCSQFGRKP